MELDLAGFPDNGVYLLFPEGRRIAITRERIKEFAQTFEANLDKIPAHIRSAADFQACPVCPEKGRARFCHALPATLAFIEDLDGFKSYDTVSAVYRGPSPWLACAPHTTMQDALQFVAALSLMYHCEVGKKYWRFFLGMHPLQSPEELSTRIYLNIYWDCQGDQQKVDQVIQSFAEEIACTCECQVKRLRLVCKTDVLMNAFVNVQGQIAYLAMRRGAQLAQSFEEFLKRG
jgi:hypothetical protein